MRRLVLALLLSASGCATIVHPERSLVPQTERGGVDVVMAISDVVLGLPVTLAVIVGLSFGGGGSGGGHLDTLLFPLLAVDRAQGTLWRPK